MNRRRKLMRLLRFSGVGGVAVQTPVPFVGTSPSFRLMAQVPKGNTDFNATECAFWAANFVGFWQSNTTPTALNPKKTTLDVIRALRPEFLFGAYINSRIPQHTQADNNEIEGDKFNVVAMYKEGTLETTISAGATTINVLNDHTGQGGAHVNGIIKSTAAGDLSTGVATFPWWFRIGNELIKVPTTATVTPGVFPLPTVITGCQRGYGGTTAAAHTAGDVVTAPLYANATDSFPDDGTPPDPSDSTLRYITNFWKDEMLAQSWMLPKLLAFLTGTDDRDMPMLDLWGPNTGAGGDANGLNRTPWNFDTGAEMTKTEHRDFALIQGKKIQDYVAANAPTKHLRLMANNLNFDARTADGGGLVMFTPTSQMPVPVDLFQWEGYCTLGDGSFNPQTLANVQANLRDIAAALQAGYGAAVAVESLTEGVGVPTPSTDFDAAQFRDFVGIGLAWEPANTKACVIISAILDPIGGAGTHTFHVPEWWYYALGHPLAGDQTSGNADDANSIDALKVGSHSMDRQWSGAYFIGNFDTTNEGAPITLPAARRWLDSQTGSEETQFAGVANTFACYFAFDYIASASDPLATDIGTYAASFGTGPYRYAPAGPRLPFTVSPTGHILIGAAFSHDPDVYYPVLISATDTLGVTQTVEVRVITEA